MLLGVQVQDVYNAIQAQFGSLIVSQFNQFNRSWFVILQSDARYRLTPTTFPSCIRATSIARWCR